MTFEFLLPLLTYPVPTPEDGVTRAVNFAAALGGRISIMAQHVGIAPITNPLAGGFYDYAGIARTIEADSKKRATELAHLATRLAAQLQQPVTATSFHLRPEFAADHIATTARTHDLTLAVIEREANTHRDVAEAALFGSGGPVVVIPGHGTSTRLETAAIAWDGGRAAARAVRDALPILRMMRVVILTASDDKAIAPDSLAALSGFLDTHGVEAVHSEIHSAGRPVAAALQEASLAREAGLMVMGAYGQNRLREFVLGGATRTALADPQLPILMSH